MYNGKLVTIRLMDDRVFSAPLSILDGVVNENGLLLINKETGGEIGYFHSITGVEFEDMMKEFGYEKQAD